MTMIHMSKQARISWTRGVRALAIIICLGLPTKALASPITFPLDSSGTINFLSPFPLIELQGTSTQALSSPVGAGGFAFDVTVHALVPNGTGSLLTGSITFNFGGANIFTGVLTAAAASAPPVVDPITLARTTVLTAPFDIAGGTGLFANAAGNGVVVLTAHRATDTSPTASFTSTGSAVVSPATVPEPSLLLMLTVGLGAVLGLGQVKRQA